MKQFGSFIEYCVKHPDDSQGSALIEAPLDPDGLGKALDKYAAPSRAKEALAASQATEAARQEDRKEIEALKRQIRARKTRSNTEGRCDLWRDVALVKKAIPKKASDHLALAKQVDTLLGRKGKELGDVCPKNWIKVVPELPRLLTDALTHPKLKRRVSVLISQAE